MILHRSCSGPPFPLRDRAGPGSRLGRSGPQHAVGGTSGFQVGLGWRPGQGLAAPRLGRPGPARRRHSHRRPPRSTANIRAEDAEQQPRASAPTARKFAELQPGSPRRRQARGPADHVGPARLRIWNHEAGAVPCDDSRSRESDRASVIPLSCSRRCKPDTTAPQWPEARKCLLRVISERHRPAPRRSEGNAPGGVSLLWIYIYAKKLVYMTLMQNPAKHTI